MSSAELSSLLRRASGNGTAADAPNRRRDRLAKLIAPGLAVGFVLILAILFGERLLPAREVTIVNVVTLADDPGEATVQETTPTATYDGTVLFQASGWIEPDPLPIKATALIGGVVKEVRALEGDRVEEGQILATLIDEDARLDLATAEAALEASRAHSAATREEIRVAEAMLETLTRRIVAAHAELNLRRDTSTRREQAGPDVFPEGRIVEARLQVEAQEAEVAALEAERTAHEARLERLHEVAREDAAAVSLAETDVARKELALSRTQIFSPVTGRVLRLLVSPGQQRMLGAENKDSGAIAYLYEPHKLQARIDVPLAEAAQLQVGQPVRVRSNFLPDRVFRGTVTRITGEADLQRNTLQAKVAIHDPDDRLRPEMLCRAEFLAVTTNPEKTTVAGSGVARVRLYVPEAALFAREDTEAAVWKLDESGRHLVRQAVTLGEDRRENYRRVLAGLAPGDRLVVDPSADLKPGLRVTAR